VVREVFLYRYSWGKDALSTSGRNKWLPELPINFFQTIQYFYPICLCVCVGEGGYWGVVLASLFIGQKSAKQMFSIHTVISIDDVDGDVIVSRTHFVFCLVMLDFFVSE